jgi:NAD(P)-dependent dehydrogenase (short-subunit alcohol dehydrogenase family)
VKRVALITGAGRGIGEATAQALARDGHAVALADLNIVEARRAARTLSGDGHEAFEVDVVDERSVEALFDTVESQLGPIAVLACVAGGPLLKPGRRPSIIETTTENWISTEALNARGPFLCIRAMLFTANAKSGRGRPHHNSFIDVRHHAREPDRPGLFGGESGGDSLDALRGA